MIDKTRDTSSSDDEILKEIKYFMKMEKWAYGNNAHFIRFLKKAISLTRDAEQKKFDDEPFPSGIIRRTREKANAEFLEFLKKVYGICEYDGHNNRVLKNKISSLEKTGGAK